LHRFDSGQIARQLTNRPVRALYARKSRRWKFQAPSVASWHSLRADHGFSEGWTLMQYRADSTLAGL
jgi:hypothetical protein